MTIFKASPQDQGHQKILATLKSQLDLVQPTTRNLLAQIHPYVARKPLNVIEEVITAFCPSPGEIVLDGFMGSGTTIFGALSTGKRAVGIDLNRVAYRIVRDTLADYDLTCYDNLVQHLLEGTFNTIDEYWRTTCERCGETAEIEREIYQIKPEQSRPKIGTLKLEALKYHCENCDPGSQKYLTKKADDHDLDFLESFHAKAQLEFEEFDRELLHNTRIAIQDGSRVSDYFSPRGMISTAKLVSGIRELPDVPEKRLIWLTLSSMIHLLKLSDWKGSTQIPYWRPKDRFTGRNPRKFFRRAFRRVRQAKVHAKKKLVGPLCASFEQLTDAKTGALLIHGSVTKGLRSIPNNSIDFVLTDPPYSDQVPYLEYTAIWDAVLNLDNLNDQQLTDEIVVSNSPGREKSVDDFYRLLGDAIGEMARVLKPERFMAIFYHEFSIRAWRSLIQSAQEAGLTYLSQVNVGRQHRSLKNVWNPKQTLDGNSLVIFVKRDTSDLPEVPSIDEIRPALREIGKRIILSHGGLATSQQLYDEGFLAKVIELNALSTIESHYDSLLPLFEELFAVDDGYWTLQQETLGEEE